jgi:DNA-binding CsgD family transcriptional regulator
VNDYASAKTITHDYDRFVVKEEELTSVFAVPLIVRSTVRGVLYGAVRDPRPIGDRALFGAHAVAAQFERDIEGMLQPDSGHEPAPTAAAVALADLADIIRGTEDPALCARLIRVHEGLSGGAGIGTNVSADKTGVLAPRELDALRLVAVGASNLEAAAQLGLSPETIKAYLRAAMRKLGVHNRTAAVHAARLADIL